MANENMKISQKGRDLIKKWEGLRLTAYQDSVGVWTIGYGHTKGVYRGMTITEAQANAFLDEDIKTHAVGIFNYVSVQLNQNQFDALVSFHYNLGPYILSGSQLLIYLNKKEWNNAANEIKKYVYAGGIVLPGLVNRRNDEVNLFLSQIAETERKEGYLDSFTIKAREIVVSGWHASSKSASGPYSYIFLMDATTGKELCRQKVSRISRPDVAKVHPGIQGSGMSGFSVSIPIKDNLLGKNIKVMSRYAKETNGNGIVSDFPFPAVKKTLTRMNSGSLDLTTVGSNTVRVAGWHLSNYGDATATRYAFLIDQTTGKEVRRKQFMSGSRGDVAKVFPSQPYAAKSGFDVTIDTTGLKGKKVKVLLRYARDAAGNSIIDDRYFDKVITL